MMVVVSLTDLVCFARVCVNVHWCCPLGLAMSALSL